MKCPFLSNFPGQFVRNHATTLIRQYGEHCPRLMNLQSRVQVLASFSTSARMCEPPPTSHDQAKSVISDGNDKTVRRCPFIHDSAESKNIVTAASPELEQDVISISNTPTAASEESKVFNYSKFFKEKIEAKKAEHSYRVFKKLKRDANNFPMASEFTGGEKTITIWCSNDYLGLTRDKRVRDAAKNAIDEFGTGAGGTRNISGNTILHEALEKKIASVHQKECAVLFTSCYNANETALSLLASNIPDCHVFSDEGNHASMINGIRNSRAPKHIFKHNDPKDLESKMKLLPIETPKLVAFESVHSMTGAVCPLEEMCEVAHRYGGITYVDEVHAVGLYGNSGSGIGERDGLIDQIDILTGTLGKAFGNMGGYVASNFEWCDFIRSYGAGFIFTTSMVPSVCAGAIKALEILESPEGNELRAKHQSTVRYLRNSLTDAGLPVEHSPSHIIPIHVGNPALADEVSSLLMQEFKHYVQAINYPTVSRGQEKLRIAATPGHTTEMVDSLVNDLITVWTRLGLPLDNKCADSKECTFCKKPRVFAAHEGRLERPNCDLPYCPRSSLASAA